MVSDMFRVLVTLKMVNKYLPLVTKAIMYLYMFLNANFSIKPLETDQSSYVENSAC